MSNISSRDSHIEVDGGSYRGYFAGMKTFYAAIDIGSNSVKLLLSNAGGTVLRDEMRITRLGEGLRATGKLRDDAIERTVAAVREMLIGCEDAVVEIVGTQALRMAQNTRDFVCALGDATGHNVRVISGQEEAHLSFIGAAHGLANPDERLLVFDIGGGSAEIITATGEVSTAPLSLPLGASVLTEEFIATDPPTASQLFSLQNHITTYLQQIWPSESVARVIGVGGVVTSIAAMEMRLTEYDGARVHGGAVSRDTVELWLKKLSAMTCAQRAALPGLHPDRAPIIIAGVAVVKGILEATGADSFTVSDHGLRHGLTRRFYLSRPEIG